MKFEKEFVYYISSIKKCRPNTVKNYIREIESFCKWLNESVGKGTLEATTEDIDNFTGYCTVDLGNASSSINKKISSLSTYYKYCLAKGKIATDPTVLAVRQPKKDRLLSTLTVEEAEMFLEAVLSDSRRGVKKIAKIRDYAIMKVFLSCGLRVSEICGLKASNINFRKHEITVIGGKGDKDRAIPLGVSTEQELKKYMAIRDQFNPKDDCDTIFVNNQGNSFNTKTINNKISAYAKVAGIDDIKIHAHSFRHTCATIVYENTKDIVSVQEMLGHSDIRTTRIYIKQSKERLRENVLTNKFA